MSHPITGEVARLISNTRYHTDAEFHARVRCAAGFAPLPASGPVNLNIVQQAAALGLLMADVDASTGVYKGSHQSGPLALGTWCQDCQIFAAAHPEPKHSVVVAQVFKV